MPKASLHAMIVAYQAQIDWLLTQAAEFETGERKLIGQMRGKDVDLTANISAEYRHKAGNMLAILEAYNRLHANGD